MPRPGTDITIVDELALSGPSLNTGTAFMVGTADDGPLGESLALHSFGEYKTQYGTRAGGTVLYDSVSAFFAEGGSALYVSRIDAAAADADTGLSDALAAFPYALGPGQVCAPGFTTKAAHDIVMAHADANKRCALVDLEDDADDAVLTTSASDLYDSPGARFTAALAPWIVYPAETAPATVTIPYSGVQAGIIARVDAAGNPGQVAGGANGISRLAVGLSQTYDDVTREALNSVGITLAKPIYGSIRTYGGRTVAGPADLNWLWFGSSRVVMAIAHEADAIGENYVLRQIDGRRTMFAALEAELVGMLLGHFNAGALFGETPADAFRVDTGGSVNTLTTIAAGEVHAAIFVKTSPAAEWVRIDIAKVPLDLAIAA